MEKKKRKSKNYLVLIALILLVTIGYALLSQDLHINGTSMLANSKWDIHWDNVNVTAGSITGDQVTQEAVITNEEQTVVEYSINLKKPGDFYEFTIDAVNEGTIDGMVAVVTNEVYDAEDKQISFPDYITSSVKYASGANITKWEKLAVGDSKKYRIKVEFKQNVTASQLPEEDLTLKFKASVEYIMYDENAGRSLTITYNKNGGSGDVPKQTCDYYTQCKLSTATPTRTGYIFNGWYDSLQGGTRVTSVKTTKNTTVYAHWTPQTYTVSYSGGGSTSGNTSPSTCLYGQSIHPRNNGFLKSHYTFVEWSNVPPKCTGNVTLVAKWQINSAKIHYNTGASNAVLRQTGDGWTIRNGNQLYRNNVRDATIVQYNTERDLWNYHNENFLYIKKSSTLNGIAVAGKEWKTVSGCNRTYYDQTQDYNSEQYCDTTYGDCICTVKVNWE